MDKKLYDDRKDCLKNDFCAREVIDTHDKGTRDATSLYSDRDESLAGAFGNLIDRVFRGYVVDFFYFKWIDFPVFNVADIYVTVTMILLLILILFFYKEEDLDFLNRKGKHGRDNRN